MNPSDSKQPDLSVKTLKGMQSVRATFTLPKTAITLLSTVASQLGVKQKSILDRLVEDEAFWDEVAEKAREYQPGKNSRKQKTFVLSRHSLSALEHFAREYQLPRDVLVEFSIRQLHPVAAREKQRHENRKALLKKMAECRDMLSELVANARTLVGEDDETTQSLDAVFCQYERGMEALEAAIEKGRRLEAFQTGQSHIQQGQGYENNPTHSH